MQYISMFGKPMKIDENFGIEVCPVQPCVVANLRSVNIQESYTNVLTL